MPESNGVSHLMHEGAGDAVDGTGDGLLATGHADVGHAAAAMVVEIEAEGYVIGFGGSRNPLDNTGEGGVESCDGRVGGSGCGTGVRDVRDSCYRRPNARSQRDG